MWILSFWYFPALRHKRKKYSKKHKYRDSRRHQAHRRRRPPPLKRYAGDVLAPVGPFDKSDITRFSTAIVNVLFRVLPFRVISAGSRSIRWEQAPPAAASAPSHTLWLTLTLKPAPWCLWPRPHPSLHSEAPPTFIIRSKIMVNVLRQPDIYVLKAASPLIRKASPALKPSWWSQTWGYNCSRVDEPLTSDVCRTFFCVNTAFIHPNVCFTSVCLTQFYSK